MGPHKTPRYFPWGTFVVPSLAWDPLGGVPPPPFSHRHGPGRPRSPLARLTGPLSSSPLPCLPIAPRIAPRLPVSPQSRPDASGPQ